MNLNDNDGQEDRQPTETTPAAPSSSFHPPPFLPDHELEESIVGLAPAYWAHVPLTIRDVHELKLWKGINCLLRPNATGSPSVLPLSKCALVGLVVAVEPRGLNGGVVYVIDDGTGMIDCLHWPDDNEALGLPSLTDAPQSNLLTVGTLVRIYGRIEVLAVSAQSTRRQGQQLHQHPFVDCIREIHASSVCNAREADGRPSIGTEDVECQHWKRCVDIPTKLLTSQDIIEKLGPDIAQQIARRESLPSADDSDGAWRVFGSRCTCNLAYKQHLLYCHCQATRESFDPDFQYRDALLNELINLEEKQSEKEPLRFQYKAVKTMSSLRELVMAMAPLASAEQTLVLGTFRALRKDGIFYLIDKESDTYLLISKRRVLEPYMETITSDDIERGPQRLQLRREPPPFLQQVPKTRLRYVRRCFKK